MDCGSSTDLKAKPKKEKKKKEKKTAGGYKDATSIQPGKPISGDFSTNPTAYQLSNSSLINI